MPYHSPTSAWSNGGIQGINIKGDIDWSVPHLFPYFCHQPHQGLVVDFMGSNKAEPLSATFTQNELLHKHIFLLDMLQPQKGSNEICWVHLFKQAHCRCSNGTFIMLSHCTNSAPCHIILLHMV